eukprot:3195434-Amphidinium_carterae.1
MAHGDTIPDHSVMIIPKEIKSDDDEATKGKTVTSVSSEMVNPTSQGVIRPSNGSRSPGMGELDAHALREAIHTSAKVVNM